MSIDTNAQESLTFQKPSKEILDLVDVKLAPYVLMDDQKQNMIMVYRDAYQSISDLSKEEMRLGGLRIDPKTNIGSRTTYYNNVKVSTVDDTAQYEVEGMPENPRLSNFIWSPDQSMLAMTNTVEEGVELWVLDLSKRKVMRLTEPVINANLGDPVNWFKDGKSLLVKYVPSDRKELINTEEAIPTGPTISVNDGKKAQNRTYQDLLKNPNDEHNFEQLSRSELKKVDLEGKVTDWMPAAMYREVTFSPDGEYVLLAEMKRPFSYIVTYYRFPTDYTVYSKDAKEVKVIETVPLTEELPQGFMAARKGKRSIGWRADAAATIHYVAALDEGDPEKEVEKRDEFFLWDAPFKKDPRSVIKLNNRFAGMDWGKEDLAIIYDYWWNNRNLKTYLIDPSKTDQEGTIINDRNYQDQYSDPGDFVTERNEYGRSVMMINDNKAYLLGRGYTEEGQFPFLDEYDLEAKTTKRLYQSEYTDKLENLRDFEADKNRLMVRIESPTEYPNYYFRDLGKEGDEQLDQLTDFANPFKAMEAVQKEVIHYKRDDGLDLTGTLYLPAGYDKEKKEKMPMILWAYPREFKDKSSAGQNTQNPNEFIYPYYGSPVYWAMKGYVILDDATFPIVGEGDEEPNDSFRKQLVANAKAAIDAVDELGYIDRNKVAVGGHSYGAFMVANLLSHSDLFAAGIARSGAYNRTLTPFGFQSEERHYWDAPEVYYTMSPFMHADKMKTPLLLVHGEADNNSGTYPMQSERYFNALKGLGATVRLVILPKESHGYRAKESILHLLWEQDMWLEKYVKEGGRTDEEEE